MYQASLFDPIEPAQAGSMRFCVLGSGSTGNATLVQASSRGQTTVLLIDCGISVQRLKKGLQSAGLSLSDLSAVFITHEHSDHVAALPQVLAHHPMPVLASAGTLRALRLGRQANAFRALANWQSNALASGDTFDLGPLTLCPFAVPHDATEPLQLTLTCAARRMGYLTDLGHASAGVVNALRGLHALVLEANHDPGLLLTSSYPPFLKRRVAGHLGHLTNQQSAQLLSDIIHPDLHTVMAAHLSLQNNRPEMALAALGAALPEGHSCKLHCAHATQFSAWCVV